MNKFSHQKTYIFNSEQINSNSNIKINHIKIYHWKYNKNNPSKNNKIKYLILQNDLPNIIDFEVAYQCLEPCQHRVKIFYDNGTTESTIYNGIEIYNLYKLLDEFSF